VIVASIIIVAIVALIGVLALAALVTLGKTTTAIHQLDTRVGRVDTAAADVSRMLDARVQRTETAIVTHGRRHDEAASALVAAHARMVVAQ
jgi:hypothetical protein